MRLRPHFTAGTSADQGARFVLQCGREYSSDEARPRPDNLPGFTRSHIAFPIPTKRSMVGLGALATFQPY